MSGGYRDKSREPDPVDEAEELQRQAAQRALAAGDSLAAMEMFAKIAAKWVVRSGGDAIHGDVAWAARPCW
jgi:hypothetical protein